jgi:site-specific DNA recombinase
MTSRAALYCRLSRTKDDKLASVEVQESNLRAVAKRRKLEVVDVFSDDGISAWNGKTRPGFIALLETIKDRRVDVVMAVRMDRFSRRNGETDALLMLCAKSNVRIFADGQEIDPNESPTAKAMAQIGGVLGELESAIKSDRVRVAKAEGARIGRYGGGPRPLGYEHDGVTIRETEAVLVRELYERIIGGEGMPVIARDWQDRGIVNTTGNPYPPADLRQTLKRPRYAGLRLHRGEIVGEAEWDAIVTKDEWQRAQAAVKARGGDQPRAGRQRRSGLLSGLARCSKCGKRMRIHAYRDGRRPPLYICAEFDCHAVSVRAGMVETEVEARVLRRLTDPKFVKRVEKAVAKTPDYSKLLADVVALETELETLASDYGGGEISRPEWMNARGAMEDRLRVARKKLNEAEATSGAIIDPTAVVATWAALDLEQRRAHISRLVNAVFIERGVRGTFDPHRVKIDWRI